jgi:hypothetical protein
MILPFPEIFRKNWQWLDSFARVRIIGRAAQLVAANTTI